MRPTEQSTILVTGATDGIGEEVARQLAGRGATVLVHGRSTERVEAARERIGGRTEPAVADLGSFAQVRELVDDLRGRAVGLDAVLSNAGVGYGTAPDRGARTEDGHDVTWQVNVLAQVQLVWGLRDRLDDGARLVWVSSGLGDRTRLELEDPDGARDPYGHSKAAQQVLSAELADRWTHVTSNALSPGWIATKMGGSGAGRLEDGADTPLWLLTDPSLDGASGRYYAGRREREANPQARDPDVRRALWDLLERQVPATG